MVNQQFAREEHAKIYNTYRPDIPKELAEKFVLLLKEKFEGPLDMAVDAGCGSGQSTIILAPYFGRVTGLDASEAQIKKALKYRSAPNVSYKVTRAELLPFPDGSVQMVTACAALHWLQVDVFLADVRRILPTNGIFAACTYHYLKPMVEDPLRATEVDKLFEEKYEELKPYWSPEVFISLDKYQKIDFPFGEVLRIPDFRQFLDGRLSDVSGFVESLSAFQNMQKSEPEKAKKFITSFSSRLSKILTSDGKAEDDPLKLYRDFYIIICRKTENLD